MVGARIWNYLYYLRAAAAAAAAAAAFDSKDAWLSPSSRIH